MLWIFPNALRILIKCDGSERIRRDSTSKSAWERLAIIVVRRFYSEIRDFVSSVRHHGLSACGSGQISRITFACQSVKYHMKHLRRLRMHCNFHYFSRFDWPTYCVVCFVPFFLRVFGADVSAWPALFNAALSIPRNLYIAVLTKPIKISI